MTVAFTPGRIVLRAPNWLGDAVLAVPAMTAVRRRFVGAHLTIAALPSVAAIYRQSSDLAPDDVMDLPAGSPAAAAALRAGRFDLAIAFPNSFRSAWELRRAGIGERWGYRA